MRSSEDIKRDVDAVLTGNSELDSTDIASKVNEGAVTLSGFARSSQEKDQAEMSVKRVTGVQAVVNELAIRSNRSGTASDPEIARGALKALREELPNAWEKVRPMVCDGHVVLEGVVSWQYIRARAEQAVRRVSGVIDIRNSITVQSAILDGDIASAIEAALDRSGIVNPAHIIVDVSGSEVTLTGAVRSCMERDEVNQAAGSAPGVTDVIDALTVRR